MTVTEKICRRALVIANPAARGISTELLGQVSSEFGRTADEVLIRTTSGPGQAIEIAAAATRESLAGAPDSQVLVAVGGDGTVREVAEGIARGSGRWPQGGTAGCAPHLLVVPAGSGNSAYQELWGSRPWPEAVRAGMDGGCVAHLDLIRIEEPDRASLIGANAGVGATISQLLHGREADESRRWEAIATALQDIRPYPGRVTVDGATLYEGPITQVTVGGVARSMRGLFKLLPRAELADGLLDVCVVTGADREAINEIVALLPEGRHLGHPNVLYAQGRQVVLERSDDASLELEHDGDPHPVGRRVTFTLVPESVPALTPAPSGPADKSAGRNNDPPV